MALDFPPEYRRLRHDRVVTHLDLSNDGTLMALGLAPGSGAGVVEVRRTTDGSVVGVYGSGAYQARGVAFGPDRRTLYFAAERRDTQQVELMRVALDADGDPQVLASYGSDERVDAIIRDRDAGLLCVLGNFAEVWSTASSSVVRSRSGPDTRQRLQGCFAAQGGRLCLVGLAPGEVVMLDVPTNKEVGRWPAPAGSGEQVALSPDARYLAAVGEGECGGVYLYDLQSGQRLLPSIYNDDALTAVVGFTCDSALFFDDSKFFRLPALEVGLMPYTGVGDMRAVSTAWEAPVLAMANLHGAVVWARLAGE